jgi:hypothetical protein
MTQKFSFFLLAVRVGHGARKRLENEYSTSPFGGNDFAESTDTMNLRAT